MPQFFISYPLRLTTSVVFVPSHRDVHHHFVYPQPPFESRMSKAEGGVSEVRMICFPKIKLCFRCSFLNYFYVLVITSRWIRTVCDFVSSYCQNIKLICKSNKPVNYNNNNNNNNESLFHQKIKLHILCYNKRR